MSNLIEDLIFLFKLFAWGAISGNVQRLLLTPKSSWLGVREIVQWVEYLLCIQSTWVEFLMFQSSKARSDS